MVKRWSLDAARPDPEVIGRAVTLLREGKLIVLPTETVYGLAADPRNVTAMDLLYQAKRRPPEKSIAYLVDRLETARTDGGEFDAMARRLAARYWPGPLTLVVDTPSGTRGYRVPDHGVALALLRKLGRPLAVTSANLTSRPPARTADEAEEALGDRIDCILDAGRTPGTPSSVVRIGGGRLEVLRQGAIPAARIEACVA